MQKETKTKIQTREKILIEKAIVIRNTEATNIEIVIKIEVATNIKAITKLVTAVNTVRVDQINKATNQGIKSMLLTQKRTTSRKTLEDLPNLQIKTETVKIIKTVKEVKKLTLLGN